MQYTIIVRPTGNTQYALSVREIRSLRILSIDTCLAPCCYKKAGLFNIVTIDTHHYLHY